LKAYFEADGSLADIGGPAYLMKLADAAATVINAGEYGRVVHDVAARRDIAGLAERLGDAPRADVYDGLSALAALFARNILIVETRPEQEIAWIKVIQQAKADLPLIVCTVEATRQ
ncbi:MAG: hypothetical protein ACFCUO_13280, partial [Rhodospirillales bacterium]